MTMMMMMCSSPSLSCTASARSTSRWSGRPPGPSRGGSGTSDTHLGRIHEPPGYLQPVSLRFRRDSKLFSGPGRLFATISWHEVSLFRSLFK